MTEKPRIMVLDDNPVAARLARSHLEGLGFAVRTATSIDEFEHVLRDFAPQIILTDVEMPVVSGDEICLVLRRNVATASIPILLFSGLPATELAARAARAGADGFICKEAGPAALKNKLDELMSDVLF